MKSSSSRRGPVGHRFLIALFASGVCVLTFWLLGYVLRDIDRIKGPQFDQIVTMALPSDLVDQKEQITLEKTDAQRRRKELESRRVVLQNAVENSQQTINQLIELQRLRLEKVDVATDPQQTALDDSLQAFLDRQQSVQQLSGELVTLDASLQDIDQRERDVDRKLVAARRPLEQSYDIAVEQHDWRLAITKLGLLLPFVLIAGGMFWRYAGGTYGILINAISLALIGRVLMVMHEHFPAIYFRYLLIGTSLLVSVWILFKLLQAVSQPSTQWLIKQSREAYEMFRCPTCEFPIRRGPMRFTAWTRRSIRKSFRLVSAKDAQDGDESYTCPCCATPLFEPCRACGKTRPSLLPACDKCGDEITPEQKTA